jgi:hypothetical protein
MGKGGMKIGGIFDFTCLDGRYAEDDERQPKWEEDAKNVVTSGFATAALDILFEGSTASTTFYVGLMEDLDTTGVTTTDTMASHAGWLRCNCYNGNQKLWTSAAAVSQGTSGGNITNSANKAEFVMSGSSTIWGGFIDSQLSKSSTTGTLVCVARFSGSSRSVASGDTVQVTYTLSLADDGA